MRKNQLPFKIREDYENWEFDWGYGNIELIFNLNDLK